MYELPEELKVESIGSVWDVTLNRPEKVNSVSQVLHRALTDVWGRIHLKKAADDIMDFGLEASTSPSGPTRLEPPQSG